MSDKDSKQASAVTSDPSLGASPPPAETTITAQPVLNFQRGQIEPSSGQSRSEQSIAGTGNPLFGATPPWQPQESYPSHSQRFMSRPIITKPSSPLPLYRPSTLPAFLKRLTYILSLVLGSSAVIAGIWSAFLLPLLHASFSARRALIEVQRDRFKNLIEDIKAVRSSRIYPSTDASDGKVEGTESLGTDEEKGLILHSEKSRLKEKERIAQEAMISSITSDFSTTQSDHQESESCHHQIVPIDSLSSLAATLRELSSSLNSTSTTRTSLLSTLESYTSHLHREVFLRSDRFASTGGFSGGYSMNTLNSNLAKAGGRSRFTKGENVEEGGLKDVGVRSEDWDAVRKEVRGIKGILLNRRNFTSVLGASGQSNLGSS